MDKGKLRALGRRLRDEAEKEGFGERAFNNLSGIPEYKKSEVIMLYLSLEKEAPTDYILERLLSDGKRVCVPVTEGCVITPCEIGKEEKFVTGEFNVREPLVKRYLDREKIDICIVPGLIFDKCGRRCGYGKGCYDMFLEKIKPVKAGLGFSKQVLEEIETEGHDIKMDYIVTEKEVICCGKAEIKE